MMRIVPLEEAKVRMILEAQELRRERRRNEARVDDYANYVTMITARRRTGAWRRNKPKGF